MCGRVTKVDEGIATYQSSWLLSRLERKTLLRGLGHWEFGGPRRDENAMRRFRDVKTKIYMYNIFFGREARGDMVQAIQKELLRRRHRPNNANIWTVTETRMNKNT